MTKAKKAARARIKKELRAEGLLPPPKPRLNRKAFSRETRKRWRTAQVSVGDLVMALGLMVPIVPPLHPITSEEIGALKVMALAMSIADWNRENPEGTLEEFLEQAVKPIINL